MEYWVAVCLYWGHPISGKLQSDFVDIQVFSVGAEEMSYVAPL